MRDRPRSWVCRTRRHDPSGDEYIALGTDCNCIDAGLRHQQLESDDRNDIKKFPGRKRCAPKLKSDERENPDLSAGIYQHNLIISAHERYFHYRYVRLAVPRNEVNSTPLSLERLEGFIEDERMKPHLIGIQKSEQKHSGNVNKIALPLRRSKQPAFVSPRRRQTKHPSPVQVPASHGRGILEAFLLLPHPSPLGVRHILKTCLDQQK